MCHWMSKRVPHASWIDYHGSRACCVPVNVAHSSPLLLHGHSSNTPALVHSPAPLHVYDPARGTRAARARARVLPASVSCSCPRPRLSLFTISGTTVTSVYIPVLYMHSS
jgi:hypothetical protein